MLSYIGIITGQRNSIHCLACEGLLRGSARCPVGKHALMDMPISLTAVILKVRRRKMPHPCPEHCRHKDFFSCFPGRTAKQVILCFPLSQRHWNSFHLEPRALFNMLGRTSQTLYMFRQRCKRKCNTITDLPTLPVTCRATNAKGNASRRRMNERRRIKCTILYHYD